MSKVKLKSIASAIVDFDLPIEYTTTSGAEVETVLKARGTDFGTWLKTAQELKNERAQVAKEHTKSLARQRDEKSVEDSAKEAEDAIDKLMAMDLEEVRGESLQKSVGFVLRHFVGWDLDEEFNEANLIAWDNISPGVLRTALEKFGEHMNGAKRKN